jgi:hypothetical protein
VSPLDYAMKKKRRRRACLLSPRPQLKDAQLLLHTVAKYLIKKGARVETALCIPVSFAVSTAGNSIIIIVIVIIINIINSSC